MLYYSNKQSRITSGAKEEVKWHDHINEKHENSTSILHELWKWLDIKNLEHNINIQMEQLAYIWIFFNQVLRIQS